MSDKQPIIIDCDPGQDDVVNLLLAFAAPEMFDILGVTTVAGNVPLALTERNARIVCDIAGRQDIAVYAGCEVPLKRPLVTAEAVHGKTGIDGIALFQPSCPLQPEHAVDFIIDALLAQDDDSVTLVPTGPLTNIAAAIEKERAILPKIKQIVLMGGALREGGNFSPSAEFNILVDPEAADIVFRCGRPLVVAGLDVTHKVLATEERLSRIRAVNNPVADAVYGMLSFFNHHDRTKYDWDGAPLHDPCTIAWLIAPELFQGKACNIEIETVSPLTLGHTAVDFWHVTDRPNNAFWLYDVDADGFFDLLTKRLSHYSN